MLRFNQPCRIKPLVWIERITFDNRRRVDTENYDPITVYESRPYRGKGRFFWYYLDDNKSAICDPGFPCDSIEDGIAKAEEWYLKRMEGFVEPMPPFWEEKVVQLDTGTPTGEQ